MIDFDFDNVTFVLNALHVAGDAELLSRDFSAVAARTITRSNASAWYN